MELREKHGWRLRGRLGNGSDLHVGGGVMPLAALVS